MAFYKRHLPHWQPGEAEYFVTFRLAGSLPVEAIKMLKSYREQFQEEVGQNLKSEIQRKLFQKYEAILDKGESGPTWLIEEKVAQTVQESIHFYDNKDFDLYAYCIMPNHVHLVFKTLDFKKIRGLENDYHVTNILQKIKSYSALESNKVLGRKGAFWQSESYDRVIRDFDELENTIAYTLNNPVKPGLVKHWRDWPYTYCKPEFLKSFE